MDFCESPEQGLVGNFWVSFFSFFVRDIYSPETQRSTHSRFQGGPLLRLGKVSDYAFVQGMMMEATIYN